MLVSPAKNSAECTDVQSKLHSKFVFEVVSFPNAVYVYLTFFSSMVVIVKTYFVLHCCILADSACFEARGCHGDIGNGCVANDDCWSINHSE